MTQELAVRRPPRAPMSTKDKVLTAVVVLLVTAVVVGGGYLVSTGKPKPEADGYGPARTAAQITAPAVVTLGRADAPHAVDVYEDPLCPYCAQFEHRFGQLLAKAADQGRARVNYHVLTFLDPRSATGTYSTRAASALLCATRIDGTAFGPLHDRLMSPDTQPKEGGSTDHTDEELLGFAAEAGAVRYMAGCLRDGTTTSVLSETTATVRPTIPGTPTIRFDGRTVEPGDLADGRWADPLR